MNVNLGKLRKEILVAFIGVLLLTFTCYISIVFFPSIYNAPSFIRSGIIINKEISQVIELDPFDEYLLALGENETLVEQNLPEFVSYDPTANIVYIEPQKLSQGEYEIVSRSDFTEHIYKINVIYPEVDLEALRNDLSEYLDTKIDDFGIYVHDLGRGVEMDINGDEVFPPASMAKMAVAILVMRDIDAGKYEITETFPIHEKNKFQSDTQFSSLPHGTEVTIKRYLEGLIIDSSNTAWYQLNDFLGGVHEFVNSRTVDELGVNPLFIDPHHGTANQLGKLFTDLYYARTVSQESRDYLLDLMRSAVPSNKEGVGLGLPLGTDFTNKIGFLWTENDLSYMDSAIVFGEKTDYVLIIMNRETDWVSGVRHLRNISEIVYSYLDQ